MILALAGQFKQLSHEPRKIQVDSTGFEMTSAMPVSSSKQMSMKSHSREQVNLLGSCFRERNPV